MKALLTLLLCLSCTRYAELASKHAQFKIHNAPVDITHAQNSEWHVGKKKEVELSQSFTFIVDLPKMRDDDLDTLIKEKEVDSWIVRLIQSKGPTTQDLGSMYTLFRPKKVTRVSAAGPAGSVTVKVYYAAAFASERFRRQECPMFEHDKKIVDLSVQGSSEEITVPIGQSNSYNERAQLIELVPSSFNGGNSLHGTYYIELAAYNFHKKTVMSPWIRYSKHVVVAEEAAVDMKSCRGIRPDVSN
jgi:hypothetical protein